MELVQVAQTIRRRAGLYGEAVAAFKSLLEHSEEAKNAREYIKTRLSWHTIKKYDIGFFPTNDKLHLLYGLVDRSVLEELNLVYYRYGQDRGRVEQIDNGFFNNHNIIIPFKDEYSNIVALAGRILHDEMQSEPNIPKYKNTPFNKSMHLFGLYHTKGTIESKNSAIIVEGQMDCLSCFANGFYNVVALTGCDLSLFQAYLLKKRTNKLYLLLDNDGAGRKAESKIIRKFSKNFSIANLRLPDGFKDVDEYLRKSGECGLLSVS